MQKMKHIVVVFLAFGWIAGWLVGCKTTQVPIDVSPTQKADTTRLPSFPAEVLYTLGKEWEAIHDSTTAKYHTDYAGAVRQDSISRAKYVEQRLIELYPEQAYAGYTDKLLQICTAMLRQYARNSAIENAIQAELPLWDNALDPGSTSGGKWVRDSMDRDESAFLELTPQEQSNWETLNRLAEQAQPADRQAFDTLHITAFEEENLLLSLLLWRGPTLFYRVVQSKARAERVARYYYGEETNSGKPGDAFKHLYVNVLLRTYTNEAIAWAVMDVYWENAHPNAPCDHFMDTHNNEVGRHTRYAEFVRTNANGQCNETRQWLLWAERVQQFVQDTTNGERQAWDKQTPSFVVKPAAKQVSRQLYIYWNR